MEKKIVNIPPKEFAEKIKEGGYHIVDLMTDQENKQYGYIEGTIEFFDVNNNDLASELKKIDKETKYLLYCLSGGRSTGVYNSMKLQGFKNVNTLEGGIIAWTNAGYPVIKD